jgi:hypothetical protein
MPGDALLQVTLDQVGTRGYDAATTMSIARASAHTEGFLFARYDSKLDLFFDATQRLVSRSTGANVAYQQQVADRYSSGMAEAVVMREFMRPGRERLRVVNLEQFRLSWHDERFQRMMNQSFEPFFEAIAVTVPQDRDAGRARAFTELVLGPDRWCSASCSPRPGSCPTTSSRSRCSISRADQSLPRLEDQFRMLHLRDVTAVR